jgi:hypothetical protein
VPKTSVAITAANARADKRVTVCVAITSLPEVAGKGAIASPGGGLSGQRRRALFVIDTMEQFAVEVKETTA